MSIENAVLLNVDDDEVSRYTRTRVLSRAGFSVHETATGLGALAALDGRCPDLVLLDVHLPDASGIDLLRAWRAEGEDVGVLVVTAAREADTVRAAAAAGAAHYLVKPFEFADLESRLQLFRRTHGALGAVTTADQEVIDSVFAPVGAGRTALPKGLSVETAAAVLQALRASELSATECADAVGVSRVSARRYLEHFAATGQAVVRLQYGGAGRPERRYRPA